MKRDELIENLRTTLLWEAVCAHIESGNESDVLLQMPENRRYAKEFMKYQIGITGQVVSTITTRFGLNRDFLCSLSENNQNVCECTAETIERTI